MAILTLLKLSPRLFEMTRGQIWLVVAIILFAVALVVFATLLAMRAPGRADEINEQAAMEKEIADMSDEEFERKIKKALEPYRLNSETADAVVKYETRLGALRKNE